jgi:hypothetical protein
MTMTQNLRKLALTSHIASSVGWIGAVAAFSALAVARLLGEDSQMIRASYLAMEVTTWFVIVPLALASLITGIVSSLGSKWGLVRHYWVVVKLVVTLGCIAALFVHVPPIGVLAAAAEAGSVAGDEFHPSKIMMVAAAGAAVPILLLLTALSVYKLRGGVTPRGVAGQRDVLSDTASTIASPQWVRMLGFAAIMLVVVFVVSHLTGNGLGGHGAGH